MIVDRDYWMELKQLLRWFITPEMPPRPGRDRPGSSGLVQARLAHPGSYQFIRARPGSSGLVRLIQAHISLSGLVQAHPARFGSFWLVRARPACLGLSRLILATTGWAAINHAAFSQMAF